MRSVPLNGSLYIKQKGINAYLRDKQACKTEGILSFKSLQYIKLEIRPGMTPLHTANNRKKRLTTIIHIKMQTILIDVTSVCLQPVR